MAASWCKDVKVVYAENAESSPSEQTPRHRLLLHGHGAAVSGSKGIRFPSMPQHDNGIETRHGEMKHRLLIHDYGDGQVIEEVAKH